MLPEGAGSPGQMRVNIGWARLTHRWSACPGDPRPRDTRIFSYCRLFPTPGIVGPAGWPERRRKKDVQVPGKLSKFGQFPEGEAGPDGGPSGNSYKAYPSRFRPCLSGCVPYAGWPGFHKGEPVHGQGRRRLPAFREESDRANRPRPYGYVTWPPGWRRPRPAQSGQHRPGVRSAHCPLDGPYCTRSKRPAPRSIWAGCREPGGHEATGEATSPSGQPSVSGGRVWSPRQRIGLPRWRRSKPGKEAT